MIRSNSSSGKSSAGERNAVPALLTRTSARPSSSTTRSASASTACLTVTSHGSETARPPCSSIVATVAAAPVLVHVEHRERRARLCEPFGHRRAEAAAAARDDGDAPIQPKEVGDVARRHLEGGIVKLVSRGHSPFREPPRPVGRDDGVVLAAEAAQALARRCRAR